MYARVEGCMEADCFKLNELEDIIFFERAVDLDEYPGEDMEVTFKRGSLMVEASGVCLEFPMERVTFFNE